ncbi:ParB N-terminal domain-containing protein [Profundibacterium mesophilum]|uniref:ParB-like partition protein n=1 Tax=Profundibacterium mesophilum KAUST100406-0324 TaxID=1037889 RepID=A0A921NNA2_9RHOB|nr:ParB N-terminal domain-containing protein [Profundibacterium mesophilum]KAF0674691.1 ParB-like partition protein [Profundibacterium mesophilum KAUST100406-0324]
MGRKRKLSATPDPDETGLEADEERNGRLGGFWGGSALNMLQARLDETQASVVFGIMAGTIALTLDPAQIDDEVGSDRQAGWTEDEEFASLKGDIERRGQKQAIRVRPASSDWSPDSKSPMETSDRFVIQSGRRRLEALRQLGKPVQAVISTEEGDARLEDLEERFKENTMRQNLSGFEELLSIGLIAQAHQDLSQAEIARRLAVPPGDVSLGRSCVELHDALVAKVDVSTTPKRDFRRIIPELRKGQSRDVDETPVSKPRTQTLVVTQGKRRATARATRSGFTIDIRGYEASEAELSQIATELLDRLKRDEDR